MNVIKRNGEIELFNKDKIYNAIEKAYVEVHGGFFEDDYHNMQELCDEVEESVNGEKIDIEEIQDLVEELLMEIDKQVAKAYILYREKRNEERNNPWNDMDERQEMILGKYLKKGETKKEFLDRVSFGNKNIYEMFKNKEALWGGRNLYAIGRDSKVTGSNCYVLRDPEDTLEDIYRVAYEMAKTYSFGGGCGINISKLRPKNMKVGNASNTTPGIMTFAELYSHITLNTQQDQRRGALMIMLNSDHPDFIEFVTTKLNLDKVNGANISIALDDKFMNAVLNDEIWEMKFETSHQIMTKKKVKARELMNLITYSNHTMGDPGMVFIDNVNNYHLLSEYEDVKYTATNPCGEQPLSGNGSCNLGSINLNAFVRDAFTDDVYFDYDKFKKAVENSIIGLDELLDLLGERHGLQGQIDYVKEWRPIGLGIMGMADIAVSMGKAYGSSEFIELVDSIMKTMINTALQSSAKIAKEKGVFPNYSEYKILNSSFIKSVATEETIDMIKKIWIKKL